MTIRVTLACPASCVDDARQLMMALGNGPADGLGFASASWADAAMRPYAVASALFDDGWPERMRQSVTRPAWDTRPYAVNLAGAERARSILCLVGREEVSPAVPGEGKIVAVVGMEGRAALEALGLQEIDVPAV
ncbi:MAG: hypothetical protein K8F25_17020 [Fimbriimonadaceae bacterium]|nr:hypothetical protein [Alphaproteobacteria bacterium]